MRSLARLGWAVGAGLVVGVAAVAVVRRAVRGGWGPTAWAALADPQWGPLSQILGGVAGALLAGLLTWWAGSWLQRRQRRDEHRDREAEADQERRALLARLCLVDPRSGALPRVSALRDPVGLGVHPAPRVMQRGLPARVPVYVPRDLDERLDAALRRDRLVLLRGASTAGKSRAAFEAMRRLPGDPFVLVPLPGPGQRGALRRLLDAGLELEDTVVWLDDLERFLGDDGLDAGLLHRLTGTVQRRAVVLSTIRAGEYAARDRGGDLLGAERELLDQVIEELTLDRHFTPAELARAEAERVHDPRIAEALARAGRYGLAEYVAAGPRLWRRWRNALAIDGPLPERVGAALVAAAIDWRRAGLVRPVPERTLIGLLPRYLPDSTEAGTAVLTGGLDWATTRVQATSALLTRHADGYVVFDYVLDQVQADPAAPDIPASVWTELLATGTRDDMLRLGVTAAAAKQYERSEEAYRPIAELGDPAGMCCLGLVVMVHCDEAQGLRWLRQAAATGQPDALFLLGLWHQRRGELEDAERWYRQAVGSAYPEAAYNLGMMLADRGDLGEAESLLRQAAEAGQPGAALALGDVSRDLGRPDEA